MVDDDAAPRPARPWHDPPVLLCLGLILFAVVWIAVMPGRSPGDGSAEAAFARDMAVHHAQAVEMAELTHDRTRSREIRFLTRDMALTQQAQIGTLNGWLQVWGLPASSEGPAMKWMDEPSSVMPGMARREDINQLVELPPDDGDVEFLRLMIPHHEGALMMAQAILERTDDPVVRRFAENVQTSQTAEIEAMQEMLEERGAQRVEPLHDMMDMTTIGKTSPWLGRVMWALPIVAGLVALVWLSGDALRTTRIHGSTTSVAAEQDSPVP